MPVFWKLPHLKADGRLPESIRNQTLFSSPWSWECAKKYLPTVKQPKKTISGGHLALATISPPSQPYHITTVTIVILSPPLSPLPPPMYWVERCPSKKIMYTWNPGMWLYLHLSRYNQDEGILTELRWALKPIWLLSLSGEENLDTQTDTQGRRRQRLKGCQGWLATTRIQRRHGRILL